MTRVTLRVVVEECGCMTATMGDTFLYNFCDLHYEAFTAQEVLF